MYFHNKFYFVFHPNVTKNALKLFFLHFFDLIRQFIEKIYCSLAKKSCEKNKFLKSLARVNFEFKEKY